MKSERLVRLLSVILFVVFLPGLTLAQAPGGVPQRSISGPDIILKLELPSYEIIRDEEGFDVIRAEGFSLSGMPGDPWLPRKVYNVAVPPDAALGSLSLEVVDAQVVKLPGAYHLRLATPDLPAIEGDTAGYHSGYTPASDAASTDPVKLLPPGQKRKYRFARLEFTPFQYDATSGELSLVRELTVRINYDVSLAAKEEVLLGDRVMDDVARQLLVNYETAQAWYQVTSGQDEPGDVYDYVIITTNAIETGSSKLADFIAHKQSLGYSVLTITEDEYGGLVGQSPNGTAEKIRKWLQDNYVIYSIEYVLLIGDPDPDDPSSGSDSVGDVPMKMCWPIRNDPTHGTRPSPTDYFFADLTGNWNLDGDLYFGEWADYTGSGGVDFANEVYVGRVPVYDAAYSTMDDILQKIIDYENEANPEVWRESALLPMSFSTSTYDGAPLAEQMMDDYLDAAGFSSWTQYQQGSGACSLDSVYASDEELRGGTVVRDHWAANDYGLVLWWGHGDQTSALVGCDGCWDGTLFNSTQTSSLDDDHPSHVYQNSCTNGYPENSSNLQYALLKQGAVSTVGATRVSWFNRLVGYGDFDGSTTNSGIGYEYAERLVGGQAAGDALYNAKASMSPEFNTRLMNFYDFNLYGDPSTGLSAATTPSAQWTFLVYLDGDNNLEGAGIDDFLEMSSVGSDSGVNIVVQFDRIPGYSTDYGDWTTTKRFLVTPGMTPTSGNALQDIGEANMGDPQTLVDFVQWGMANYPADHYAVILWNHGSGWRLMPDEIPLIKGVIYDDTDGDHIDMPELRSAMDTLSNNGSDPLDLVGFDACLMAMIEVDNQLIPYVDVRVGSEEIEPGDGWPYDDILSSLSGNPAMSASQLGTVIVDEYYASYGNDWTQSAVDLHSPYSDLNSAVNDFAVALINGVGSHHTDIATARSNTQEFGSTYIDLYDFAYQVNQYVSDATINAAATDVMDAVNSAVIQEQHGAAWPGAHGISIYFPESEGAYDSTYDGSQDWLEFTANTQWDEWLHAFYSGATCNDPHEPNETPGQATSIGYGTTLTDPDICPAGDVDYYAFAGSAGDTIIADIDAQSIGSSLDSYLYLYDTDGVTELTYNDDYDGLDSRIEYTLPADGTYYLMVREYSHPSEGGPGYFYTISLQGLTPFDVDAGWTFGSPTVDGQIAAGEWDDAATYDITLPRARSQSQRDPAAEDMPEVLLRDGEQQQMLAVSRDVLSTVTLYAMNDGTHLYLAIDNPNDTIADDYDQMGVYFDDNPLPSDGQWTNTSCGNPDGEGNFWVITDTVTYREWITDTGPTTCDLVIPAPGTVGAVRYGSGHTQSEIAIDLTSSALRATPGDAISMYMWIYDAGAGVFDGQWPMAADFQDPSTYRPLTLATCPVPAVPSLSSPADSSSTCDTTPDFDWSSVSWATSYRIQVDDNSSFGSPEIDTTASNSNYTPGSALSPGTYYWHVWASNSCGDGSWSPTWSFTIMSTPAAPSLSSPPDASETDDTTPTFSWVSVSGATSYRIQVDDNFDFSSPAINQTTSSTSYTPGSELPDSDTYYWQVRAFNSCGSGPWSAVWEFAIPAQSPWVAWIYLPAVVRGYP